MDRVKNYFKGGKTDEQRREERRRTIRASIRLSGVPSTIAESSPQPDHDTWESLGERAHSDFQPGNPNRLSRFSFATNVTQESTQEEIDQARASFRQSMSGSAYRRHTIMAEKNDLAEINESALEDSMSGSSDKEDEEEEPDEKNILDELKHEIMVNYLFQQQCARLWIADGTGEVEGVMLRKSRGNYLACPPALADSVFADSCVELNVPVGHFYARESLAVY